MKFAHLADCHIGGWTEPRLSLLSLKTFKRAIDICVEENVGFILIAGDLFDTSLPSIDLLKEVASSLDKARSRDIDVYVIPGSHDFSPSGKTMLDVLEKAGLLNNVAKIEDNKLKFILDKTNTKITGLFGKKRGLEKVDYLNLNLKELEEEKGFKIFMFHTLINEFKPKELEKVEGQPLSFLPKNFNYYAGGHPHFVFNKKISGYGLIVYPGALFPNNFKELEEFKNGGFYIIDDKLNLIFKEIKFYDVLSFLINVEDKTSEEVEKEILSKVSEDVKDKIITIRVEGVLEEGKPGDINFKNIIEKFEGYGAYIVLRNTAKLVSKEFKELEVETGNIDEIEDKIVKEHLGQIKVFKEEEKIINELMNTLSKEKEEGETNAVFEERLLNEILKVLELEKIWGK